jgi:hypothetical protein
MLISTTTGGGEIVSPGQDTRFYDDIGCLAADWAAHHEANAQAYVRIDAAWREAQAASYAQPDRIQTAMASGIVAFETCEAARAADHAGRSLTFDEIVKLEGARR